MEAKKNFYLSKPPFQWLQPNDDTARRITCIQQMKMVIDRRYEHWIDAFNSWDRGGNAIFDIGLVGINAIGAGVGGITSQAMNALSGFLTSARGAINSDILYQKSVEIIITQMKTDRAKWDTIIQNRLQATQK